MKKDCSWFQALAQVAMKMAHISAGSFVMGSPKKENGRDTDEGPEHTVDDSRPVLDGPDEVTQAQYKALMGTSPAKDFVGPDSP